MSSINTANLTLTTVNGQVTIGVAYNAVFSVPERHMAGLLGFRWVELIEVRGVDGNASTILTNFPAQVLPVTDGPVPQTIARSRSLIVSRATLQEDLLIGDADEIQCRIENVPSDLPMPVSRNTDIEVLLG